MKDPTPRMLEVLRALRIAHKSGMLSLTGNQIARACGYQRGQDKGRHSHNGRAMAPAQRVIFPLIGLRQRGLVDYAHRRDGLSGTAYALTNAGLLFCNEYKL